MDVTAAFYCEGNVVEAIAGFLERTGWAIVGAGPGSSSMDSPLLRPGVSFRRGSRAVPLNSPCGRDYAAGHALIRGAGGVRAVGCGTVRASEFPPPGSCRRSRKRRAFALQD
jgi:hypothetical protein